MLLDRRLFLVLLFGFIAVLSQSVVSVEAQRQVSYQVGAWGDDSSRGNLGVAVEIRTHVYDSYPGTFDYFWVGDNLANGAFIQFGYGIEPGSYCLKGSSTGGRFTCLGTTEQILVSDARWQWQYWPKRENPDFYYQIGDAGSAGVNGTWHQYRTAPAPDGSWAFEFDGKKIASSNFHAEKSSDPEYLVAEKVTPSSSPLGNLGPVEFANLSYLTTDGWNVASSLVSFNYCPQTPSCNMFGIAITGQNATVAGSGVEAPASGSLLWTRGYESLAIHGKENSEFQVTFLAQEKTYRGDILVSVPKGLYVYVTIPSRRIQAAGPLGLIGGYDQFIGWTGDQQSNNLTIRILMSENRQIASTWASHLETPVLVLIAAGGTLTVILFARRLRKPPPGR